MKKKLLAVLLSAVLFISGVSASTVGVQWAYVGAMIRGIEMKDGAISWSAVVSAYDVPSVTDVKVVGKLQVQAGSGWGTLDTQTAKEADTFVGVGGTYADWAPNRSYRVEMYGYIYNGSTLIESVGPLYAYLNT